jgi:hypothetical protein
MIFIAISITQTYHATSFNSIEGPWVDPRFTRSTEEPVPWKGMVSRCHRVPTDRPTDRLTLLLRCSVQRAGNTRSFFHSLDEMPHVVLHIFRWEGDLPRADGTGLNRSGLSSTVTHAYHFCSPSQQQHEHDPAYHLSNPATPLLHSRLP